MARGTRMSWLAPTLALALASCASPGARPRELAATSASPGSTTASPQPTSEPEGRTPSPAPDNDPFLDGCPRAADSEIPEGSGCLSSVEAELDGDGARDRFLVYASLDADGKPTSWTARAVLATGERRDAEVPFVHESIHAHVVGAVDADLDGRDEAFVMFDRGASTEFLAVYALVGGRLLRVTLEGEPLGLGVFGSVGHAAGARCEKHNGEPLFVIVGFGLASDPDRFVWEEESYRWVGKDLRPVGQRKGEFPKYDEERMAPFYRLSCWGFTYGD